MASRSGSIAPLFLVCAVLFLLATDYAAGISVTFTIQKQVEFGRGLRVAGNTTELGNWEVGSSAQLEVDTSTERDWSVTVDISVDVGVRVEFKPLITDYGTSANPTWFPSYNLVFQVPEADTLVVPIIWPDTNLSHIKEVIN